nr:MAG TPA: hypothetical protein [Caudoviricetes sp.]
MFDWDYYLYRFAGEDETVEWLRVKNHDGAITWQWNLSVNNATSFDTISEAKSYAKKYCKTFDDEVRGIAYLTPVVVAKDFYSQETLKEI